MSLFSALAVSASGMAAQRIRAGLLVQNLANAETTRTPEGGPYRRKDVVFVADPEPLEFSEIFRSAVAEPLAGVKVSEIVEDMRPPELRYLPGHPDANEEGYVAFPAINPAEDMVDLLNASRGYAANVSAMTAVKEMIQRSLDLLR